MATKKPSGLGRGLGELLEDNTPETKGAVRSEVSVGREGESITITPKGSTEIKTKALFEKKHKNRSVKSNFKK